MITVASQHGIENEVVFEQRTPNTMRGYLIVNLTASQQEGSIPSSTGNLSARNRSGYPRHFLWRLRIADGSAMLCSKLCGMLTVSKADEIATEKITITLATRINSSGSMSPAIIQPLAGSDLSPSLDSTTGSNPGAASIVQLPAYLKKESKLKVQWIELSSQSGGLGNNGQRANPSSFFDVAEAQKALQSATKDRHLLDTMFRNAGARLCTADVHSVFGLETSHSTKTTARFTSQPSSISSLTLDRQPSSLGSGERKGSASPIKASPRTPARERGTASQQQQQPLSSPRSPVLSTGDQTTAASIREAEVHDRLDGARIPVAVAAAPEEGISINSRASSVPIFQKPFWLGFLVGCTFGATAVLAFFGPKHLDIVVRRIQMEGLLAAHQVSVFIAARWTVARALTKQAITALLASSAVQKIKGIGKQ